MYFLIVDNHTSRLAEIRNLLARYGPEAVETILVEKLVESDGDDYDLVILTGATGLAIPPNMEVFKNEFALIRKRNKPLLGICSGFQAIQVAFGGRLNYRPEGVRGIVDVKVNKHDDIFGGLNSFKVFESHKYFVDTPVELIELARSSFNIEVIKHASRPIYGFQFHPEVRDPENNGSTIFRGFMNSVVGRVGR